jgi:hypothetical protein
MSGSKAMAGLAGVLQRVLQDPHRALTGLSGDQLGSQGAIMYPEENAALNQQAHRLGAKILTDRFGAPAAQGLGLANELAEAYELKRSGTDRPWIGRGAEPLIDISDLEANVRGSLDSPTINPITRKLLELISRRR